MLQSLISKKRTNSSQDEDDESGLHCCSGDSSFRPTKSAKTHDKQSISPCTAHCEKYNQAVDLIESGSIQVAVSILKSLLTEHEIDTNQPSSSLHNILVKASIKLAASYCILSLPEEALKTLDQVFLPNQKLYISYGHNLFGEAAVIYAQAKDGFKSTQNSQVTSESEFRTLYVKSCLCGMGYELLKVGKHAQALTLFQTSIREVKKYSNDVTMYSHPLKQMYIQALLASAQCHLALGSLSNVESILKDLRVSERSLSLNYNNPKFLEMVKLEATANNYTSHSAKNTPRSLSGDIAYGGVITYIPDCHYQTLCAPPDSSMQFIRSSFRTLSKILHPDKGGDNGLMQRLLMAYAILKDQDKRNLYDKKCRVVHPNFHHH